MTMFFQTLSDMRAPLLNPEIPTKLSNLRRIFEDSKKFIDANIQKLASENFFGDGKEEFAVTPTPLSERSFSIRQHYHAIQHYEMLIDVIEKINSDLLVDSRTLWINTLNQDYQRHIADLHSFCLNSDLMQRSKALKDVLIIPSLKAEHQEVVGERVEQKTFSEFVTHYLQDFTVFALESSAEYKAFLLHKPQLCKEMEEVLKINWEVLPHALLDDLAVEGLQSFDVATQVYNLADHLVAERKENSSNLDPISIKTFLDFFANSIFCNFLPVKLTDCSETGLLKYLVATIETPPKKLLVDWETKTNNENEMNQNIEKLIYLCDRFKLSMEANINGHPAMKHLRGVDQCDVVTLRLNTETPEQAKSVLQTFFESFFLDRFVRSAAETFEAGNEQHSYTPKVIKITIINQKDTPLHQLKLPDNYEKYLEFLNLEKFSIQQPERT